MSVQINIIVPDELAEDMDLFVGDDKSYENRSQFIRSAIRDKVRMLKAGSISKFSR